MGQRWTIRGKPSWDIEAIVLDGKPCFRVRYYRGFLGYCYSVDELRRLLELRDLGLADLIEVEERED